MNHYNQNQQPREEIVDRLHDTLSVLRRERDELHRANQLAIERLRLLKEERVAAEKNLSTLQSKYNGIVSSNAKDERRGEISKLQSEVERLGREVRVWLTILTFLIGNYCIVILFLLFFSTLRYTTISQSIMHFFANKAKFQHMELIGKREKINKLRSSMKDEDKQYSKHRRDAKEALIIRRDKVALRQANHHSNNFNGSSDSSSDHSPDSKSSSVDRMNVLLAEQENVSNLDFFVKIARLIEKKSAEAVDEANALRVQTETASRRVSGYERYMQKDDGMNPYADPHAPMMLQQ